MDIEIEQNDNKMAFLETQIELPDPKVFEKMKELGLYKTSSKRKDDRITDRLNISLNIYNHFKNKKQ